MAAECSHRFEKDGLETSCAHTTPATPGIATLSLRLELTATTPRIGSATLTTSLGSTLNWHPLMAVRQTVRSGRRSTEHVKRVSRSAPQSLTSRTFGKTARRATCIVAWPRVCQCVTTSAGSARANCNAMHVSSRNSNNSIADRIYNGSKMGEWLSARWKLPRRNCCESERCDTASGCFRHSPTMQRRGDIGSKSTAAQSPLPPGARCAGRAHRKRNLETGPAHSQ